MKTCLPLLCFGFMLLMGCSTQEAVLPVAEEMTCNSTSKAVVERMNLNEDGSEFFYYLRLDTPAGRSATVFPKNLSTLYQKAGERIDITFANTNKVHTYVVCLAGHVYDPSNPDSQTMPVIEICSVNKSPH